MLNELSQQQTTHAVQQFSETDARKLVEDMLLMYGKKFTDQWSGLKKSQVIEKFVEKLSELTYEQFLRGLKRLDTAEWPPSIPEFKNWCKGVYEYQTPDEAWLQALNYEKSNRVCRINRIAREAFYAVVGPYGSLKPTDTVHNVYCSVYKRLIAEAKERGELDEKLPAVKQLAEPKQPDEIDHQPVPNEVAQQALEELKKRMNVKNRHVPAPQRLQVKPTPIADPWPDPFENPESYLEKCEMDGVKVPKVIREQLGGGV